MPCLVFRNVSKFRFFCEMEGSLAVLHTQLQLIDTGSLGDFFLFSTCCNSFRFAKYKDMRISSRPLCYALFFVGIRFIFCCEGCEHFFLSSWIKLIFVDPSLHDLAVLLKTVCELQDTLCTLSQNGYGEHLCFPRTYIPLFICIPQSFIIWTFC